MSPISPLPTLHKVTQPIQGEGCRIYYGGLGADFLRPASQPCGIETPCHLLNFHNYIGEIRLTLSLPVPKRLYWHPDLLDLTAEKKANGCCQLEFYGVNQHLFQLLVYGYNEFGLWCTLRPLPQNSTR